MAERMVRTQIYLPPKVHAELKRRAGKQGLTLAIQIREALEAYLHLMKKEEDIPPLFDPAELFAIIDNLKGGGPPDLAENHDKYLYSDLHGEINLAQHAEKDRERSKLGPVVRERRATYRVARRASRKRKGGRK